MNQSGAVLLFRGRGIISSLIRWQTRGDYSHAALLLPDGRTMIEAWQGDGVRKKVITDWSGIDVFDVDNMTEYQWHLSLSFARAQIGAGYDYLGVLRFLSRSERDNGQRWFCSELVFKSLETAGIRLLERVESRAVHPTLLSYSPFLKQRKGLL